MSNSKPVLSSKPTATVKAFSPVTMTELANPLATLTILIDNEEHAVLVRTMLDRTAYQAVLSPENFRPQLASIPTFTKQVLITFHVFIFNRGQRISNFANKNDASAAIAKELMVNLRLRNVEAGDRTGFTVGRIMACFPEIGVYVRNIMGVSKFQDQDYPGPWPIAYQTPAGFSCLPFHLIHKSTLDNDVKEAIFSELMRGFMHYQNWYIEVRAKAASNNRNNTERIIATNEDKQNARHNSIFFLNLQKNNPWNAEFTEALWNYTMGGISFMEWASTFDIDYDPITNTPDVAYNFKPVANNSVINYRNTSVQKTTAQISVKAASVNPQHLNVVGGVNTLSGHTEVHPTPYGSSTPTSNLSESEFLQLQQRLVEYEKAKAAASSSAVSQANPPPPPIPNIQFPVSGSQTGRKPKLTEISSMKGDKRT